MPAGADAVNQPWAGREVLILAEAYGRGGLAGQLTRLSRLFGRTEADVAQKARSLRLLDAPEPVQVDAIVKCQTGDRNGTGPARARGRASGGRRADLGGRYFRSSWEANYARFLTWSKVVWEYEPRTFRFETIKRGIMSYTPDFWLPGPGLFHEVKGWMDPKSKTRMARMKKFYPEISVVLIGRDWFREAGRQGLPAVIPHWERRA